MPAGLWANDLPFGGFLGGDYSSQNPYWMNPLPWRNPIGVDPLRYSYGMGYNHPWM